VVTSEIGALKLEDGIQAKTVPKGHKDVCEVRKRLTSGKSYMLARLQLRVTQSYVTATVLFANNATAKLETGQSNFELGEGPNDHIFLTPRVASRHPLMCIKAMLK
jgi:hypothetical protein